MRTLAIGDIHGCLTALDVLLTAVAPEDDDVIVTLGDYVDRGPDSCGVIERLLELDETHQLVPLKGNHEIMMLDARDHGGFNFEMWMNVGGRETLLSYGDGDRFTEEALNDVPPQHWEFIEHRLVDYHETDTYIFVHAGYNPVKPLGRQNEGDLFWRKLEPDVEPHFSGKPVICGHTSQKSGEVLDLGHVVCLDTWACGEGWLTCLEVESGKVWQANEERAVKSRMLHAES